MWMLLGRLLVIAAALLAPSISMLTPPDARAETPNTISAFVQPMAACQAGRMNIQWCEGLLGAPAPISPDSATNTPLWAGTGYALCWITAAGATLPAGASCSESGTAIATGSNFSYPATATFPVTFDGSGGSGCEGHPNDSQNSFFFLVDAPGTCVITVSTPAAVGFSPMTTVFTLTVEEAPVPTLLGPVTAASGTHRTGTSAPLQTVTCTYLNKFSPYSTCPGVILNWAVTSGSRVCSIVVNTSSKSRYLDSVSISFRRPGRCTVQATYPEVPGKSAAYTTTTYSYQVKRRM